MLTDAILFAAEAHRGQTRKSSPLPYVVHPLEAMHILIRHGVRDEVTLAAAVLHDVVEDCGVAATDVERRFGTAVAEAVAALTKPAGGSTRDVKTAGLEQVRRGPAAARMVKMADRLSNLRDLEALPWNATRKAAYRAEAEQIARVCGPALPALADELLRTIGASRAGQTP